MMVSVFAFILYICVNLGVNTFLSILGSVMSLRHNVSRYILLVIGW